MQPKQLNIISWALRLVAALIMLQTLYFKFSAAPESVYIFTQMKIEPWGRILTGIMELIASALILFPPTTVFGALLALGIMSGALLSHVAVLGIEVQGDGGQLFIYALLVWIASLVLIIINRKALLEMIGQIKK